MRPRITTLLLLPLWLMVQSVWAAPVAELCQRWQTHDSASTAKVDHAQWRQFLSRYLVESVDGINRLCYSAVSIRDR